MGFLGRVKFLGRSPLTIIELIIAVGAVVGGLYVLSPLLAYSTAINGATPVISALGHPLAVGAYGACYFLGGGISIIGIFSRRVGFRSVGIFVSMMARTYGLFVTFLIQGFLPLTWWSSAIVLAVSVVIYIWLRGLILRNLVD